MQSASTQPPVSKTPAPHLPHSLPKLVLQLHATPLPAVVLCGCPGVCKCAGGMDGCETHTQAHRESRHTHARPHDCERAHGRCVTPSREAGASRMCGRVLGCARVLASNQWCRCAKKQCCSLRGPPARCAAATAATGLTHSSSIISVLHAAQWRERACMQATPDWRARALTRYSSC